MAYDPAAMRWLAGDGITAGDGIRGGRRVRDVADKIALLDADNTPMISLLMQLNKHSCTDVKFEWQEDIFPALTDTIEVTSSTLATLTPTTIALYRPDDVWLNGDSGEVILVTAVGDTTMTVVRGIGDDPSTDAQAIAATDNWFFVGAAAETGSQARNFKTTQISQPYNYCQLFKEGFEVSGTLNATKLYGGADINYLRYKHAQIHQRDKERMCWFGVRDRNLVSSGRYRHTSRGLITDGTAGWITTNESETNSSGEYTEDEFDVDLQTAFRYGSSTKFMFCSPMALSVVSSWGRDKLQTVPRANTMGVNITRYVSPHGELNLVNEKMFQDFSTAGTVWGEGLDYSKMAVILDMKNIYLRTLRDTILEMGIQENDRDSIQDQYMTECGLQVVNEEQCMAIYGFDLT